MNGGARIYLSGRGFRYKTMLFPPVKGNSAETAFTILISADRTWKGQKIQIPL
jgi:hypothetical protein